MKRYLLAIAILFTTIEVSAHKTPSLIKSPEYYAINRITGKLVEDPLIDFRNNRCAYIGAGYNVCDGVGGSVAMLSIHGFYLDYGTNTEGDYSNYIGVGLYDGYYTRSWHVGYSIPITKNFKITPIIGEIRWEEGYWDGSNWWITKYGIVNNWVATNEYRALDYGVSFLYDLDISPFISIALYLNVQHHNIGAGFAMSFPYRNY